MHTKRNLCHDDIKLDNVFLTSFSKGLVDTHWLLGDLGNARQLNHTYHTSRLWSHDNDQLADCRSNDAIHLVEVYVQFLRLGASEVPDVSKDDIVPFDAAFFYQQEPWSRFYWAVISAASSKIPEDAGAVLEESLTFPPQDITNQDDGTTEREDFLSNCDCYCMEPYIRSLLVESVLVKGMHVCMAHSECNRVHVEAD
jgi:hypothetical protein